jgi:hypothetical protein
LPAAPRPRITWSELERFRTAALPKSDHAVPLSLGNEGPTMELVIFLVAPTDERTCQHHLRERAMWDTSPRP